MVSGNPIALPGNAIALPGNPVALPSKVGTWQSNGTPGLIGTSFVYKALGMRTIHTNPCFVEKRFGAPIKIGTSGTSFVYNAFGACTTRTIYGFVSKHLGLLRKLIRVPLLPIRAGAPTKNCTSSTSDTIFVFLRLVLLVPIGVARATWSV